jgi:hypothetical protein
LRDMVGHLRDDEAIILPITIIDGHRYFTSNILRVLMKLPAVIL